MAELGTLDSGFLELEDTDRHVSAGIGVVAIVAGPPPDRAEFIAEFGRRLTVDQRMRQRVRTARWDLAAPHWDDDPDFDIARHIRWMAVPRPHDDKALFELVATMMEQRLDRDHPLWQCVVVERLAGDRWAMLVKAHHSMVDGMSGIALFERLCDSSDVEPPPRGRAGRMASLRDSVLTGLRLPVAAPRIVFGTLRSAVPLVTNILRPAPDTSLNGPIGRQRRYAVARTSLSDVREIGAAFGATVNDVALAALTEAFRTVLLSRGEDPAAEEVRILAPVSTRPSGARATLGNQVSIMLPVLPVHLGDPVEQLAAVHTETSQHKSSGEVQATNTVLTLAGLLPFAPLARIVKLACRFPQHSIAGLATNVRGPKQRLFFQEREVLELSAYVPIAMRLRTGIGILSYDDQLRFGITGDFDGTPEVDVLARGIEDAVGRLLRRVRETGEQPSPIPRDRGAAARREHDLPAPSGRR
ncbi:wax ester/triacylglycerol synthase family O-acyltransferase [Nocardia arizonensis]|uniref:wax ester/triacylglycerol synthase family O-acyltransferase n=1 Tax=Nocardia arizonensis TaxID=1141647 RepID=UPI0009E6865A|nr:wax ester/triacylglycerol synthase family O-acyltransferase [Nocardia arizonensis]